MSLQLPLSAPLASLLMSRLMCCCAVLVLLFSSECLFLNGLRCVGIDGNRGTYYGLQHIAITDAQGETVNLQRPPRIPSEQSSSAVLFYKFRCCCCTSTGLPRVSRTGQPVRVAWKYTRRRSRHRAVMPMHYLMLRAESDSPVKRDGSESGVVSGSGGVALSRM